MTEQSTSKASGFMHELDLWTEAKVIMPLENGLQEYQDLRNHIPESECEAQLEKVYLQIRQAIREKVLESYRNGQKAGQPTPHAPSTPRRPAFRREFQKPTAK
jgi:hypothetical protein